MNGALNLNEDNSAGEITQTLPIRNGVFSVQPRRSAFLLFRCECLKPRHKMPDRIQASNECKYEAAGKWSHHFQTANVRNRNYVVNYLGIMQWPHPAPHMNQILFPSPFFPHDASLVTATLPQGTRLIGDYAKEWYPSCGLC
jgi:hypothetical protein